MVSSSSAVEAIQMTQQAFDVISTLNLFAFLNPYDGCIKNGSSFHYIIAGGGTSGAVLANRLSEDKNIHVLLLEAGGDFPMEAVAIQMTQQAFDVISTLNLFAFLNPYDGCIKNGSSFHYIIAGGGTSGAVLANRLSEDKNIHVLLLEAGGDFPMEAVLPNLLLQMKRSRFDWGIQTENDNYTMQCNQVGVFQPTIGKLLGGSSSVDFMLYSQGDRRDYEDWEALTSEPSWSYNNVLRLFKKIEKFEDDQLRFSIDSFYHGFSGKVILTKEHRPQIDKYMNAFKDVGHKVVDDINDRNRLGITKAVYYIKETRQNSALCYLTPVRQRPNLVILKTTTVTQIIFENKKAVGVRATSKNNEEFIFKAKREVIVCAGAFNTPKILQLSGIGPKELLDSFDIEVISDLPVGDNYMNHVATTITFSTETSCEALIPQDHDPRASPCPAFFGYVALNKTQKYADYRTVSFVPSWTPPIELLQYPAALFRFKHCINDFFYKETYGKELMYTLIELLKPRSKGTVHIRSKNPNDNPMVHSGYFSNDEDMRNMIRSVKDFLRVEDSEYFKAVGAVFLDATSARCSLFDKVSDDYYRCFILCMMTPLSHHAGTAAMGAVVDGRLRVKGVKGLRVVDASIMPELVSGSTTFPVMMIGENGAEMIKDDWKNT